MIQGEWYSNGTKKKPLFRGVFHEIAFALTPVFGYYLLNTCKSIKSYMSCMIYMIGWLASYGFSSQFHRRNCSLKTEIMLSKLDHAGIFLMTAGSYTPLGVLALQKSLSFLFFVWIGAFIGIYCSFLPKPRKTINTLIYICYGSIILMCWNELKTILIPKEIYTTIIGLLCYCIGGFIYILKKPDPIPDIFGFHELLHLCTIIGGLCAYFLNYSLASRFS